VGNGMVFILSMFGHYHLVNPVGTLDYSRGSSAL